ncbi:MAG: hypothetical protein ACKO34_01025 [Vampirovibrionales bacterium]
MQASPVVASPFLMKNPSLVSPQLVPREGHENNPLSIAPLTAKHSKFPPVRVWPQIIIAKVKELFMGPDTGYSRVNFSKITQVSALEAMIKFYTQDISQLKLLGKEIPTNLARNLEGAKKRAIELGYNPEELLKKHNPLLSLSQPTVEDLQDFNNQEIARQAQEIQKKRDEFQRMFGKND